MHEAIHRYSFMPKELYLCSFDGMKMRKEAKMADCQPAGAREDLEEVYPWPHV
jgi:hypothetical protein